MNYSVVCVAGESKNKPQNKPQTTIFLFLTIKTAELCAFCMGTSPEKTNGIFCSLLKIPWTERKKTAP